MNIPDYTLLQSCGKGAYGQVWLAQSQTNKLVALKYVANSQAGDREFEGLINYSQLPESPHLIRILHLGKLEDGFFYTMELADGLYSQGCYVPETLAERLKRTKRLPVTEVMDLAAAMLSALGTLHEADMVHRDLKPENILYVNGTPKLSDVGLVRSSEQTVSLGGTLGFIPPERLKPGNSAAYNASDDLYALGKVLYCALTGNAVEKFPSVPPEMINNTLCCHLNQIILKACGNEEDRFKNTGDFLSFLQNGAKQEEKKEIPCKKILLAGALLLLIIITSIITAKISFTHEPAADQEIQTKLIEIQKTLQIVKENTTPGKQVTLPGLSPQQKASMEKQMSFLKQQTAPTVKTPETPKKQVSLPKQPALPTVKDPEPAKSKEPLPKQQAEQTPPPPPKKTISEAESNQLKLELRRWKDKERVQIEKQQYTDQEKKFMDLIKKADDLKEKHGKKTFIEYSGPTGNTVPAPDLGRIPRRMTKLFPLKNAPKDFAFAYDNTYAGNLPRDYVIKGYIFFDDASYQRYLNLHSLYLSFYNIGSNNSYDIYFYIWLSATKGTLLSFQAKDQTGTHTTHLYNHFTNANENYLHRLQEQNHPPSEMGIPFELIKMRDNIVLYINDQLIMNVKNEKTAEVPSFSVGTTGDTSFMAEADNWEIYDITPDPDCPPEEAYVLPDQRKKAK